MTYKNASLVLLAVFVVEVILFCDQARQVKDGRAYARKFMRQTQEAIALMERAVATNTDLTAYNAWLNKKLDECQAENGRPYVPPPGLIYTNWHPIFIRPKDSETNIHPALLPIINGVLTYPIIRYPEP